MNNIIKWEVVEELSDEDGTVNCWAHKLGPADYVYITHNYRKTFDVERSAPCSDSGIATIKSFKRFNNAKRFAESLILSDYEI